MRVCCDIPHTNPTRREVTGYFRCEICLVCAPYLQPVRVEALCQQLERLVSLHMQQDCQRFEACRLYQKSSAWQLACLWNCTATRGAKPGMGRITLVQYMQRTTGSTTQRIENENWSSALKQRRKFLPSDPKGGVHVNRIC